MWIVIALTFAHRIEPPTLIVAVWGENEKPAPLPTCTNTESTLELALTTIVPVMPPASCGIQR